MTQKRCLNCGYYTSDERTISGGPLPKGAYPNSGVCQQTGERKRDGWACGEWKKNTPRKERVSDVKKV